MWVAMQGKPGAKENYQDNAQGLQGLEVYTRRYQHNL